MEKQQQQKNKVCSPHCIYFPQTPDEINETTYTDGVTHRKVVRRCRWDGHVITGWEPCENREDVTLDVKK